MSHPPPDSPGSDITDFAAWEAQHPDSLDRSGERERSLLDMARPERKTIWADRDSSNDARSSDSEVEVVKERTGKAGLGKRKLASSTMAGKEMGMQAKKYAREIPSSDAESEEEEDDAPPRSQPRPESEAESEDPSDNRASDDKEEHAVRQSVEQPVAAKPRIYIEISSDEESEEEPEDEGISTSHGNAVDGSDVANVAREGRKKGEHHILEDGAEHSRLVSTEGSSVGGESLRAGRKVRHRAMKQSKHLSGISLSENGLQPPPVSKDAMSVETISYENHDTKALRKAEKKARRMSKGEERRLSFQYSDRAEVKESVRSKKRGISTVSSGSKASSNKPSPELPVPAITDVSAAAKPNILGSKSYYTEVKETAPLPKTNGSKIAQISAKDQLEIAAWMREKKKKRAERNAKKKAKKMAEQGPKKSEYFKESDRPTNFTESKATFLPFSTIHTDEVPREKKKLSKKERKKEGNWKEEQRQMEAANKELEHAVEARSDDLDADTVIEMERGAKLVARMAREAKLAVAIANGTPEKKKTRSHKKPRNKNRLSEKPSGETKTLGEVFVREDDAEDLSLKKVSGKQAGLHSSGVIDGNKPNARRDRGRKRKTKEAELEIPDVAESAVAQPSPSTQAEYPVSNRLVESNESNTTTKKKRKRSKSKANEEILESKKTGKSEPEDSLSAAEPVGVQPDFPFPDVLVESIVSSTLVTKKKRKRNKKADEENLESTETGRSATDNPLLELADTNSKKSKKQRRGQAISVDATRSSTKSSKAHHSQ